MPFSREAQPSASNFGYGISDFGSKGECFTSFVNLNPKSEIRNQRRQTWHSLRLAAKRRLAAKQSQHAVAGNGPFPVSSGIISSAGAGQTFNRGSGESDMGWREEFNRATGPGITLGITTGDW